MYLISKVGNLYTWTLLTVPLFRPKIQIRVDRRQKTFDIGCCIPSYSKNDMQDLLQGFFTYFIEQSQFQLSIELKPLKGRFQRLASDIYLVKVKRTFSQQRRFLSQDKNLFFSNPKNLRLLNMKHENSFERVDQVHLDNQFCGFSGTFIFDDFDDVCYVIFPMWFSVF